MSETGRRVAFGEFSFDLDSHELWHRDRSIALAPKPGAVLAALLERPGDLVFRDDLYAAGWGDTVVSLDLALNTAIRHIRRALGDEASSPRFVQTVTRRGYRFVAPVTPVRSMPEGLRMGRLVLPRRSGKALVWAAAAVAALFGVTWLPTRPPSTIEVQPIRLESSQADAATGIHLEDRIRNAVVRKGRGKVAVLASSTLESRPAADPEFVVRGRLRSPERGETLVSLEIVRASDWTVLWAGTFNPHCPRVSDPVGYIAKYVAQVLVPRVT